MLKLAVVVAGPVLIVIGLYFAPAAAGKIQNVYRDIGEEQAATVVSTGATTRTFQAGGRRGGTQEFHELTVDVLLESGRTVTIDQLVRRRDQRELEAGDEVSVTLVRGDEARERLPHGPYYLLTSSVDAGRFAMLGWAFNGRPAHPLAILFVIPGVIMLLFGFAVVWETFRPREADA